jgi:uncharacterized protein YukE
MSGFEVNPDELRTFAGKLDGYRSAANELAGFVGKADVGAKSWGVVGIFVKEQYTQTLSDLNDLFNDMQGGLQSGADKFRGTAQGYEDQETALKKIFEGIQIQVDKG